MGAYGERFPAMRAEEFADCRAGFGGAAWPRILFFGVADGLNGMGEAMPIEDRIYATGSRF
jgi:hypothetical protein